MTPVQAAKGFLWTLALAGSLAGIAWAAVDWAAADDLPLTQEHLGPPTVARRLDVNLVLQEPVWRGPSWVMPRAQLECRCSEVPPQPRRKP